MEGGVLWNSSDGGDRMNLLGLKFVSGIFLDRKICQVLFGWIELSRVLGIQNNQ